ncbi:HAMP domain-containing sensor histidine kinase [Actinomadura rudentiformis]|uniref:histidine kinase n=1 Tax=Actinomadura rudentiformis TaxID=359158 RepID=A0A6H9YEN3_9ACTN|nr:HAMP domain-containing sensor histidine kinase [Actinomadura rudentiformis]KAB2342963.1 HAMP domain-containing histidine kinase [Actinomadura rudentiformis]
MIRQLVTSYVLLVTVALAAFTVPVAFTLTAQVRGDTEESVRREATTMALLLAGGDAQSRQALDRMVAAYQRETPGRIAVIPGETAQRRDSARWGSGALVVTAPARASDGRTVGAIRITYPTSELNSRLWRIWWFRAALAVGVIMVAALLGRLAARRLTRPLRQLNEMASKFSDGDLTARSPVTGPLETRTLARTLNLGAERLQTLLDAQRIFVADASHQLRTPLTALRLSLDNIADGVDDEFAREDIEQATAEVVRMSRLVNGLLVLADEDAKVTVAEPVPLGEVIADRLELWRTAGDERGVRFSSGPVDGRLRVLAGPGHLEQVLDNVLSNALAVSPDGATVQVTVAEAGDEVVLEVQDEGPGMPDAGKSRAFDRFWRGQGLTGRSGSGLGLAIVKRLVTGDGGSVALGDAPGGGLVVRVSLRAAPPRSGG